MSARARVVLGGLLCGWAVLQVAFAWPDSLVDDWHGWRQADTQAIARNFAAGPLELFHPRIDWGGDGPGYVETELSLYPALVALALRATGDSERPGQVISLLFWLAAAAALASALARRHGETAGLFGAAALLASRPSVFLATAVMPEPALVCAYVCALGAFLRASDERSRGWLALAALATVLAALLKPTALSLGIVQFAYVLFARRELLRWPSLWLAWAVVLFAVGAHLFHAQSLYLDYGNTFGVIRGGDLKFPRLEHLLQPASYRRLAEISLVWGIGVAGALAGLYLLVRRSFGAFEWALALGTAAGLLVSLRYSSALYAGRHYHVFAAVLGAWLVGRAVADLARAAAPARARVLAPPLTALALALLLGANLVARVASLDDYAGSTTVALGRAFAALEREPGLVIVRSDASDYDEVWRTSNNFEDPRIFYLARAKGWSVPANREALEEIRSAAARGARYYVEPRLAASFPVTRAWLAAHATLVHDSAAGRVWRLAPVGDSPAG